MTRTEPESDRRREVAELLVLPNQQRAFRMVQASAEKLEHTGPTEMKRVASVPQRKQLASTPEPPLAKGKSRLFNTPDRRVRESQGEREPHLGERGGIRMEA